MCDMQRGISRHRQRYRRDPPRSGYIHDWAALQTAKNLLLKSISHYLIKHELIVLCMSVFDTRSRYTFQGVLEIRRSQNSILSSNFRIYRI